MQLAVGQVWEEVDRRRREPRRFVIVNFTPRAGIADGNLYCVRYFGLVQGKLAPNPKSGRSPRRFNLASNEVVAPRFLFTGKVISVPDDLESEPSHKGYGL